MRRMDKGDHLEIDSLASHVIVELQGLLANVGDAELVRGAYGQAHAKLAALGETIKRVYPR